MRKELDDNNRQITVSDYIDLSNAAEGNANKKKKKVMINYASNATLPPNANDTQASEITNCKKQTK